MPSARAAQRCPKALGAAENVPVVNKSRYPLKDSDENLSFPVPDVKSGPDSARCEADATDAGTTGDNSPATRIHTGAAFL